MRGSRGGRGNVRGGRGGSGGGAPRQDWSVAPTTVIPVGTIMHPCEEYVVLRNEVKEKVPIFNRPLYLENKTKIGVIDDVFGPISDFMFSVKCDTGVKPESFKEGQKLYMNPEHPLADKPKKPKGARPSGVGGAPRGGARGGFRGGFNNSRGSGGNFRGAPRGGAFRGAPRGGSGFRGKY